MKKTVALLLALLTSTSIGMLFAAPAPCLTAFGYCGPQDGNGDYSDNLKWELACDGVMTVTGSGEMADWNDIPAPWDNYKESVVSVILPEKLTKIGSAAFKGCSNLTSLVVPDNVTEIGQQAFYGCTKLKTVRRGSRVRIVGEQAFRECGLTSLNIPKSITEIGEYAFSSCTVLKTVTFRTVVPPAIGRSAFDETTTVFKVPCGSKDAYDEALNVNTDRIKESVLHAYSVVSEDETRGTVVYLQEPSSCENPTLTFRAASYGDYEFLQWSDGLIDNPRTITLTQDTALTAQFIYIDNSAFAEGIGTFSINERRQVKFAPGNLQYNAAQGTHPTADGTTLPGTWRFATRQWNYVGDAANGNVYEGEAKSNNLDISASYDGWIDLLGWGTGSAPTLAATNTGRYMTFTDWGRNVITYNGNEYEADTWRTLSRDEWVYLVHGRENAANLFGMGTVHGVQGFILLPDYWTLPEGLTFAPATKKSMRWYEDMGVYSGGSQHFTDNVYTLVEWLQMQSAGAVFLPAAGYRTGSKVNTVTTYGYYWSSADTETSDVYSFSFRSSYFHPQGEFTRSNGFSVRLVSDIPQCSYQTTDGATVREDELPFTWESQTFNEAGTKTLTLRTADGCDSVVTFTLRVVYHNIVLEENESDDYYTRFAEEYNGHTVASATLNRQFKKGVWSTLCLPFDVKRGQMTSLGMQGSVYEFKYATGDADEGVVLYFTKALSLNAGQCYIVNANNSMADKSSFTFSKVTIDLSNDVVASLNSEEDYDLLPASPKSKGSIELVGTLRYGILKGYEDSKRYIGLKDNKVYYPNLTVGNAILAYRGIFRNTETLNISRVRIVAEGVEENVQLTMDNGQLSQPDTDARKFIKNDILLIERNGKIYNIQGEEMQQKNSIR